MGMNIIELPNHTQALVLLKTLINRTPKHEPQRVDRPLVLYGAGKLGKLALQFFDQLQIPVAYAIDTNPPPGGLLQKRIPVLKPEDAPKKDYATHLVAVCVVLHPYQPIHDYLHATGWHHVRPFYDIAEAYSHLTPLNNGWFAGTLNTYDIERIGEVLNAWSDDVSRAAYLQFLAWRLHREEWQFQAAPVTTNDRYFISEILQKLGPNECFLDGGAWHGEVSQRFITATSGCFREILAIEADRENNFFLREWAASLPPEQKARTRVFECALGNKEGIYPFTHGYDLASRLMHSAVDNVSVRTIDSFDFQPSFIKLHLEGGELEALKGAQNTLTKHRPMIAVTLYHSRDGLWKIPSHLFKTLKDYQFFFRLHAWCGTGAVLYAIPIERKNFGQFE